MERYHESSPYLQFAEKLAARLSGSEEATLGVSFDGIEGSMNISLADAARDFIGMGSIVRCLIDVDVDLGCSLRVRPRSIFDARVRHFLITSNENPESNQKPLVQEVQLLHPYDRNRELGTQLDPTYRKPVPDEAAESLIASITDSIKRASF